VLAGGSRERLLMSPQPGLCLQMIRTLKPHAANSRLETFAGAACYTTLGSAMFCRAIRSGVYQKSKAAPLQALGLFTYLGKPISLVCHPLHELVL